MPSDSVSTFTRDTAADRETRGDIAPRLDDLSRHSSDALPCHSNDDLPCHSSDALPCHSNDPDLWFAEAPADLEHAKSLCASCPVRAQCLAAALDREEPWGVWGGEILDHGTIVARKRPRGRPRKHPVVEPRKELVCA